MAGKMEAEMCVCCTVNKNPTEYLLIKWTLHNHHLNKLRLYPAGIGKFYVKNFKQNAHIKKQDKMSDFRSSAQTWCVIDIFIWNSILLFLRCLFKVKLFRSQLSNSIGCNLLKSWPCLLYKSCSWCGTIRIWNQNSPRGLKLESSVVYSEGKYKFLLLRSNLHYYWVKPTSFLWNHVTMWPQPDRTRWEPLYKSMASENLFKIFCDKIVAL